MELINRWKRFAPEVGIALVLAILYLKTLAPTVTFGDSGELITAAYTLGIPHPPGFPTWTLITKLFTLIPVGNIAWRVNLASATYATLTAIVLFSLLKNLTQTGRIKLNVLIIAILVSIFFATTRTFWSMAVAAEVHTLLVLLLVSVLLSIRFFITKSDVRFLYLSAVIYGLSIGVHYMAGIAAPAIGFWIMYLIWKKQIKIRQILLALLYFLLGLSIFIYLPIRAYANPPVDWGNPSSPERFLKVITRRQFTYSAATNTGTLPINLPINTPSKNAEYVVRIVSSIYQTSRIVLKETNVVFFLFVILGIVTTYWKHRNAPKELTWLHFLSLATIASSFLYIYLTTPSEDASKPLLSDLFIEQLFFFSILALWAFYGAVWISNQLLHVRRFRFAIPLFMIFLCGGIVFQVRTNYLKNDMSRDRIAYQHAVNILTTVENNGVLFIDKNYWLFPVLYATKVEGMRPDIELYDRTGNLFNDFYQLSNARIASRDDLEQFRMEREKTLVESNPEKHYYYAADKNFDNIEHPVNQEGILYKYNNQPTRSIDFTRMYADMFAYERIPSKSYDSAYIVSHYYMRYADELLSKKEEKKAFEILNKAYSPAPDNRSLLTQLGTYYMRLKKHEEAEKMFLKSIELEPTAIVPLKNLALIYASSDNNEKAIELHRKILALDPSNSGSVVAIIMLYSTLGNCQEAQQYIPNSTATATIELARALNALGICYAQKNMFDAAEHYWKQTLNIDPNNKNAQDNLLKLEKITK